MAKKNLYSVCDGDGRVLSVHPDEISALSRFEVTPEAYCVMLTKRAVSVGKIVWQAEKVIVSVNNP